ncbi:MAG: hypothetical protein AB7G87_01390 [Clostridia bacterium]
MRVNQVIPVKPFNVRVKSCHGGEIVCPVLFISVQKNDYNSDVVYFAYSNEERLEYIDASIARIVVPY